MHSDNGAIYLTGKEAMAMRRKFNVLDWERMIDRAVNSDLPAHDGYRLMVVFCGVPIYVHKLDNLEVIKDHLKAHFIND